MTAMTSSIWIIFFNTIAVLFERNASWVTILTVPIQACERYTFIYGKHIKRYFEKPVEKVVFSYTLLKIVWILFSLLLLFTCQLNKKLNNATTNSNHKPGWCSFELKFSRVTNMSVIKERCNIVSNCLHSLLVSAIDVSNFLSHVWAMNRLVGEMAIERRTFHISHSIT